MPSMTVCRFNRNAELMEMLKGVQDLQNGQPSTGPDFFGFTSWNDILCFARSGEGEHLQTFVNLVDARGERQLMWALKRIVSDEEKCNIIVSTAHKAKGREWSKVRPMGDFMKSKARRPEPGEERPSGPDPAELRLFYVALTRAREELEVTPNVLGLIGASDQPAGPAARKSSPSANESGSTNQRRSESENNWEPPRNWQPKASQNREAPNQAVVPPQREKRGFMKWLLGK